MRKLLLFLLLTLALSAKSVTASFTYTMGDSDTKLEARQVALQEAKRAALEKLGVWVQTETLVENDHMTKDEIRSFVAGFAKTRVLNESFDYPHYTVTVEVDVDETALKQSLPPKAAQPAVAPVPAEQKQEAQEPTPEVLQPEKPEGLYRYEVGALFGSGSVEITTKSDTASTTKQKESMGFGGLKLGYFFTPHQGIEFIGGGGSTKINGEELKISTAALAYLYRFGGYRNNTLYPFAAFGLVSGTATQTVGSIDITHKGAGAILHLGCKWRFSQNRHHQLEAGLLVQSFVDSNPGTGLKSVGYGFSQLAFGYSYLF